MNNIKYFCIPITLIILLQHFSVEKYPVTIQTSTTGFLKIINVQNKFSITFGTALIHIKILKLKILPISHKGEPDLCHFLVIGALKPFLDRNLFPFE